MKLFKRKRFTPYTTTFRGNTLHVHDHASFRLGRKELFREEVYKFISPKTTPFIIDCGSNIGMSILYFKSLFPGAKIIGFEADPYIFSFLEKNIRSYNLGDVTVLNRAVWDADDETLSFLAEGGAGGRLQERSGQFNYIDVKTTRLKNYLVEEIDFLKIDIEGAEHKVIADCADELRFVKNLFIEYHSMENRDQNLHLILEIIYKAGFRYHIKEAYTTPFPFIERRLNVGMDLQLNIFCYRP
ncbi:FkbM family methyltransferase [Terrimonas pollutisoli]|uniref:FkbM family methyltransferase n=1 Tax=Terrimonas pollutisoli TaxID=3034147 RepID=UPI0023ECF876|nr:FkbM family methyltransferase [Terrimonas sp. H1YJ31]